MVIAPILKLSSTRHKSMLLLGVSLFLFANGIVQAGTVAASQQEFVKKYAKQKNVPKPENMLVNTAPEPKLSVGFTPLFNGKNLTGWTPKGGRSTTCGCR